MDIEMDALKSLCQSEESLAITATRRTYSSKNTNTLLCSPAKRARYSRTKYSPKKRRRGRKFEYYRSAFQFFNKNPLKKRISILEKIVFNKRISSGSSYRGLVPHNSVSRIFVTEETICMDSASKSKSEVRRSSYRRVSALHIHELNKSSHEEKCPLIQGNRASGDLSISRAFRRLVQPRKKNVRMQTLPEPDPPPPPSPTESEKELDFQRRLEIFQSSNAYRRLTAPPKSVESPKNPVDNLKCGTSSLCEELNKRFPIAENKPPPPQNTSPYFKFASFKRKNLLDPFNSPKTMALIERAHSTSTPTPTPTPEPCIKNVDRRPYRSKRVFERLTAVKDPIYPLRARPGNPNIPNPSKALIEIQSSQAIIPGPVLTVERRDHSKTSVSSIKELKGFPSARVFNRLTALPKKPRECSDFEKALGIEKGQSEESVSSWKKLREFQASRAYRRLTTTPKPPIRDIVWNKCREEETKGLIEAEKEESGGNLDHDQDGEGEDKETSPIFQRLLAPRKKPKVSDWGRVSSANETFSYQKIISMLTNKLPREPLEEIEEPPPPRMTSAFRRLTAPNFKQSCSGNRFPCFADLDETRISENNRKSILKKSSFKDRQRTSSPKTIKSNSQRKISSTVDENLTDTSYETISDTSDVSGTTFDVSDISDFECQDSLPLLRRTHPSAEARAECNNILGEIATLKRKMAQRMSQMASEIYDGSGNTRSRKEYMQRRNKAGSTWCPLKSFRPVYEWQLKNPKTKWPRLTAP